MTKPSMEKMLHICWNPHGWSEEEVRNARQHVADAFERAKQQIEAARKDAEWQPIETAPSDHLARLFLFGRATVITGFVDATGVMCVKHEFGYRKMKGKPTHWMPLPAPPAA